MKVTSAYANKMLKKLNEEKEFWITKERESMVYTAAIDEDPVIPDYDYNEVTGKIRQIDEKIYKIKHAINLSNLNSEVDILGKKYSIDTLLVHMAQINKRKSVLDRMRKQLPKSRVPASGWGSRKTIVEYRYVNYDLDQVSKDFDELSQLLFEMQMKLDEHNQNVLFDLEIE